MKKTYKNHQNECVECDISTQERLNYFTGQFLTERDFHTEQEYQISKHRQHNRYLHGYGTVCGLKVVQHPNPDCRDRFIIIQPGLGLDCCGREIWLKEPVYVDIVKALAPQIDDSTTTEHLLISLCYTECKTEFVPALYSDCGCDTTGYEANRIFEGFEVDVQLVDKLPSADRSEPFGVNLKWVSTINLAQASRLALDANAEKIYVLTAANPGQIAIYDTNNYLLIGSIAIGTGVLGVDMAIAPSGRFLYVICQEESGDTNNYSLKVIDIDNPDTPVNNLPLTSGISPPQIIVSPADGRIYTLENNAAPKKLIIWKTDINTTSEIEPDTAKDLEITNTTHPGTISENPQAIALSPDGIWLFIADGTDNQITASKIETLVTPSPETATINLGESPSLLAVAGDSSLLYTVTNPTTGDKKVRAFRIAEESPPFPEIQATTATTPGVTIGTDIPVAITVSNSGKWAYVVSKDSSDKGKVRAVNGEKIAISPSNAVSEPLEVVSAPEDILLDSDKSVLYVAGKGTTQPGGGISVLDIKEEACQDIVWQALEGCPECPEDFCVPLAVISEYTKDKVINDVDINNRIRPLVTSAETLRKLILCALENRGSTGDTEGSPGTPGSKWFDGNTEPSSELDANPGDYYLNTANGDVYRRENNSSWNRVGNIKGNPGNDGTPGEGLESGLTQITNLSWQHNTGKNPLAEISHSQSLGTKQGIVIAFSKPVLVSSIDADHIFQVLVENEESGLVCRCAVKGIIIPVEPVSQGKRIIAAQEIEAPMAEAAAFLFDNRFFFIDGEGVLRLRNEREINQLWVRLRGDFVLDKEEKAIDAEFVRGELPTGDRPRGSDYGSQGGTFESWFWIGDRPKPEES
ncbi:MAG: YncE family protein [Nostocales cyanobacterium 94392]|nr:YncE family protein [Nostocales cyanobacterium 94392]